MNPNIPERITKIKTSLFGKQLREYVHLVYGDYIEGIKENDQAAAEMIEQYNTFFNKKTIQFDAAHETVTRKLELVEDDISEFHKLSSKIPSTRGLKYVPITVANEELVDENGKPLLGLFTVIYGV